MGGEGEPVLGTRTQGPGGPPGHPEPSSSSSVLEPSELRSDLVSERLRGRQIRQAQGVLCEGSEQAAVASASVRGGKERRPLDPGR